MSFIGKNLFSLSWLGLLFNDSLGSESHDEGLHQLKEYQVENTDYEQDFPIETAEEATVSGHHEELSEPEEESSNPTESFTVNRQDVPDDFVQHFKTFLKSRSPSPSFRQRKCQRDDAAEDDSYLSESPLSLSTLSDFSESSHFNEESSFEESFEKSSTGNESDCSLSFNEPPREPQCGNHLIVMAGEDFGWSLSDAADDPRRTGLANFRHNILIRPVPAPSVETLANLQESRYSEEPRRGTPYSPHPRSARSLYFHRGSEVRSDYETGCGSASSSFDEEGYHRYNRHDDHHSTRSYHWERRQPHDLTSDTEEASSRQSRAGKPYRRRATFSQCSDSCLGSDFPSLTSTGSSESEMIGVTGQSSIKSAGRLNRAIHAGTYTNHVQQQQPKAIVEAAATNAPAIGASSTTSSQTSLGSASTDCWRGSIHHALAMMEHRGQEMSSLFDQLHEIGDDLADMDDQVGQVTNTLQQCQNRRPPGQRRPFLPSQSVGSYHSLPRPERRGSTASSVGSGRRRHVGSSLDLRSLNEDEMAVIVHRLLTRVCEQTLARQEGKQDVPLIV